MKPTECETKQLFEAIEMWFARDPIEKVPHKPWTSSKIEPIIKHTPTVIEGW